MYIIFVSQLVLFYEDLWF